MKVVVVDGRFTLLGSHNFTQSALRYNHELSVLVDSPCLAGRVLLYLRRILRESGAP
jgi:phosphatidylserine/phosphatidylglycerophosphate/cardiolipin synthase-like enzyme